ncbi:hypothetical protein PGB90_000929 [Kerria lacca]
MTECYRNLILNSNIPIVFHESLNWNCLKWNSYDWCNSFQNKLLPFRCGKKICQKSPYWESLCEVEYHTMDELVNFCNTADQKKPNTWWYFDYKHISEHFNNVLSIISWSDVGFREKGPECSTIWIGSPGAHTPCHIDTYGCNVVAQVFGRKRWLLFPPTETKHLKPTRVPYEESSIYSNINFSCFEQFKDEKFENIYVIDLYPGDILFVPPRWWHYVENLSLAISINTWISLKNDDIYRMEEALVRYFISSITATLSDDVKQILLNPNELDIENNTKVFDVLNICKNRNTWSRWKSRHFTYLITKNLNTSKLKKKLALFCTSSGIFISTAPYISWAIILILSYNESFKFILNNLCQGESLKKLFNYLIELKV